MARCTSLAAFSVSLAAGKGGEKSSNEIDLVMKFKRGDPPEGVARIIETFVNSITPVEVPIVQPEEKPPEGTPGDQCLVGRQRAGDTVDFGGLKGLLQRHGRKD